MSITNAAPIRRPARKRGPLPAGPSKSARFSRKSGNAAAWPIAIILGSAIVILAVVLWWLHARNYESTDDAFIDTRTVQISPQVAAAVVDVPVTDNQSVEAGAELVRLDDRDYIAQRDQAQANVDNLIAQIASQEAKIDQSDKQVTQAQAALSSRNRKPIATSCSPSRALPLSNRPSNIPRTCCRPRPRLRPRQANAVATKRQDAVLKAQLESARAQLAQAATNLSRTIITAPVAGRVTQLTAAKGAYAAVGQALMMFVPRDVWITANFKETQLDLMRPGQPVDIEIDAYPDRTFEGHVDSVQAGSGTAFSLLPAQNATGNYVKIVQRVPVKIVFNKPPDVLLGPGMSVVPTVKVR